MSGAPRPPVSVVVPTRDRPESLRSCLQSLRRDIGDAGDIIVVDSASTAPCAVAEQVAEVSGRLIRCATPGVNRARNAGWRAAITDAVLFVDDDVVVEDGWAAALLEALQSQPTVGFVSGRILPPADRGVSRDVAMKVDETSARFNRSSVGNIGHGANLAFRRSALERVGGWDEALGIGARFLAAPEHDVFDRLFADGWSGAYEPGAVVRHDHWRGPRGLLMVDARYGVGSGARLSKLLRADRRRFVLVARDILWDWGFRELGHELRARHGFPAAGVVVRLSAAVAGFIVALLTPVQNGHFASRRRRATAS